MIGLISFSQTEQHMFWSSDNQYSLIEQSRLILNYNTE